MTNKTIDSYGRKINYLRISVTDRCNLRCSYCMPERGVVKKTHASIMRCEEIVGIAKIFSDMGIDKVRITGGEPLVRSDIEKIVRGIKESAAPEILAMTTNGLLLDKSLEDLKNAGLTRLNISLDTLDDEKLSMISRISAEKGTIKKLLKVIERAVMIGFESVKINTVLIGGFNEDEIPRLADLAEIYPIDVRFIELMPIGEASGWAKDKFVKVDGVLRAVPGLSAVPSPDISSPAKYYKTKKMKGRIGLIDPISCSFCKDCNRVRITPDGKLKTCLHGIREYDILKVFRTGGVEEVKALIKEAVLLKPESHAMGKSSFVPIERNMNKIGG